MKEKEVDCVGGFRLLSRADLVIGFASKAASFSRAIKIAGVQVGAGVNILC